MISDKHWCLFVHVLKTGGQSVELFFLRHYNLDWDNRAPLLLAYNDDRTRGPERLAHLYASEYVPLGYIDAERFRDYYKFAFVRNPWSRLVSEYRYRSYGSHYSFKEFVKEDLPAADDYTDAYRHIVPQSDYVLDKAGKSLVDFVGRFETLQKDFERVCEQLGFDDKELPRRNVSPSSPPSWSQRLRKAGLPFIGRGSARGKQTSYVDYYDAYTRDLVADLYRVDIENFGYEFGAGVAQ